MARERQRLLELALETLENKRKEIDEEIAAINKELRGRGRRRPAPAEVGRGTAKVAAKRKRSRFTKEERLRRSQRMKAYWDKWRKEKGRNK